MITKKLLQTIKYCSLYSPYYKNLFKKHNIDPKNIKTLDDFRKIPITNKFDLCKKTNKFEVSMYPYYEWVTTSGTSTDPISVPLTLSDLQRLQLNEKLSLSFAGIIQTDTVLLAVAMDKLFIAGLAYYLGIQDIGASVLRVGTNSKELVIKTIEKFKPSVIIGVPSFLLKIAREKSFKNQYVKKIIAIGEPVSSMNFERNNVGKLLEDLWKAKVLSTYASTEMSTSFCECEYQNGGHYIDDLVFIEILDKSGNPVPPGTKGELIVTPLQIQGFPLLRYSTNDIAVFHEGECKCGYKRGRLSPIIGRKSQMLKIKGTTVFLNSIIDALSTVKGIKGFFIQIFKNNQLSDNLHIKVVPKSVSKIHTILLKIQNHLKGILRVTPAIEVITYDELIKLQSGKGTKSKFFEVINTSVKNNIKNKLNNRKIK